MKKIKGSIQELFDSRYIPVPECGCWIWTGSMTHHGYGLFFYKGIRRKATHVSWELHNNKKFPEGKLACHRCDTKSCVNPHHIFVGTYDDNNLDAAIKGRRARGNNHPYSKITEQIAIEIKNRLLKKEFTNMRALAKEYGISDRIVWSINDGRNWSYLFSKEYKRRKRYPKRKQAEAEGEWK